MSFLALFSALATCASAQTPILDYRLNETGSSAASTGSNKTALTFYNASGTAEDLHSASGSGVSGLPGDEAFNNTASTGMGSSGVGGVASVPANTFGTLDSFTFECWFNASTPPENGARLFDSQDFLVESSSAGGTFFLYVNGIPIGESSPEYSDANKWIFFAVSYDGTQTSNNVSFYEGTTSTAVTQVGTNQTINGGSILDDHAFNIGNYIDGNIRPFDGYLDDVRLFGSTSDSSGVIGLSQLEAIRQEDIQNVPEPSAGGLLIAATAIILSVRKNRITELLQRSRRH